MDYCWTRISGYCCWHHISLTLDAPFIWFAELSQIWFQIQKAHILESIIIYQIGNYWAKLISCLSSSHIMILLTGLCQFQILCIYSPHNIRYHGNTSQQVESASSSHHSGFKDEGCATIINQRLSNVYSLYMIALTRVRMFYLMKGLNVVFFLSIGFYRQCINNEVQFIQWKHCILMRFLLKGSTLQ